MKLGQTMMYFVLKNDGWMFAQVEMHRSLQHEIVQVQSHLLNTSTRTSCNPHHTVTSVVFNTKFIVSPGDAHCSDTGCLCSVLHEFRQLQIGMNEDRGEKSPGGRSEERLRGEALRRGSEESTGAADHVSDVFCRSRGILS